MAGRVSSVMNVFDTLWVFWIALFAWHAATKFIRNNLHRQHSPARAHDHDSRAPLWNNCRDALTPMGMNRMKRMSPREHNVMREGMHGES